MAVETPAFVDECVVHVRGGAGGNGVASFRREAHVPRGGPDGGDGGRGGDVVLLADHNVTSLLDVQRAPHLRGGDGGHGSSSHRSGATGTDRVVPVPVGTVVKDLATGEVLADLRAHGQRAVVAEGGRGGRGNAAFANRYRRVPRFAERGERTQEQSLRLELRLIADVGLVGMPSAGKSSLVGRLSAAKPRVEAWPFTTLTPHLGVMRVDTGERPIDVVLADVPGLIEGASEGKGLGTRFLRHIERCLVLLFVLDGMPFEGDRDPLEDLRILREELRRHAPELLERPSLLVITKVDLPDARVMVELVREQLAADARDVLAVSAVTGEGLDALRYRLGEVVAAERERLGVRAFGEMSGGGEEVVLRLQPATTPLQVSRDDQGRYVVTSRTVERWVQMLLLDQWEAVRYLQGRMRRAGVERALIAAGARSGDDVVVGDAVFEFEPDLEDLPAEEREAVLAAEQELDLDDPELDDAGPDDAGLDAPALGHPRLGEIDDDAGPTEPDEGAEPA